MPFFSIIIPTFNRLSLLAKTIEQLASQTYTNFQIIIVEDGYNNEEYYKQLNDNLSINYKFLESKKSVSAKRNIGAKLATSEYLIFLDDDDFVTANWLRDFYNEIQNSKPDIVFCAVKSQLINNTSHSIFPAKAYKDERSWGIFLAGAFAVKKNVFETAGNYDEVLRYGENTELGIRLKQHIKTKSFINSINLIYTASQSGGSKNIENTFIANNHILAKHQQWFSQNKQIYFNYLSVLGVTSFKLNKTRLAQKYFSDALLLQANNYKAWYRFLISRFPFIARFVWHK